MKLLATLKSLSLSVFVFALLVVVPLVGAQETAAENTVPAGPKIGIFLLGIIVVLGVGLMFYLRENNNSSGS
jgi:hypothetical protein